MSLGVVCGMLEVVFGVCFRLLGNFWPPALQTEIKLRFSSVRGQLVSLCCFNIRIIDSLWLSVVKNPTIKRLVSCN